MEGECRQRYIRQRSEELLLLRQQSCDAINLLTSPDFLGLTMQMSYGIGWIDCALGLALIRFFLGHLYDHVLRVRVDDDLKLLQSVAQSYSAKEAKARVAGQGIAVRTNAHKKLHYADEANSGENAQREE